MFHLLKNFQVSLFMEAEWYYFWERKDINRLVTSLIINEQNVIQRPVIDHPLFKKTVFHTALFLLQDWLHFSYVLFPTMDGHLYGASVNGFRSVTKRIDLGKRLAEILFREELYPHIYRFAKKTPHTGSRNDYERYLSIRTGAEVPPLRAVYPVIQHKPPRAADWSALGRLRRKWFSKKIIHKHPFNLTAW